jgi:pimeloyl-ACP methyl ester carboxylesterase
MSDVAALVDRLKLETFALIGTSMGGIIAMAYASAQPQRLKSLVINDIGPVVEQGSQRITDTVGARPSLRARRRDAERRSMALGNCSGAFYARETPEPTWTSARAFPSK